MSSWLPIHAMVYCAVDSAYCGNTGRDTQQHCDVTLWPDAIHWNVSWQYQINEVSTHCSRRMDRLPGAQCTHCQGLYFHSFLRFSYFQASVYWTCGERKCNRDILGPFSRKDGRNYEPQEGAG